MNRQVLCHVRIVFRWICFVALLAILCPRLNADFKAGVQAYEKGKYAIALKEFNLLGSQGHAPSQFALGTMYDDGVGVAQDDSAAAKWYRLAADQGHAVAQNNLGVLFKNGEGVVQDYGSAVRWFRLAADQGYQLAQLNLAIMYSRGYGVRQDFGQAFKLTELAAMDRAVPVNGDSDSGSRFSIGIGLEGVDIVSLKKREGKVKTSPGLASAQFNLAVMYQEGQGVKRDMESALKWYEAAANQGYMEAQYNLGLLHDRFLGSARDTKEAIKWYRLAAKQGYADAQTNLGLMFEEGRPEFSVDYKEAIKWYRLSAAQGNTAAQINLGLMYLEGHGVPKDYIQAYMWFEIAAAAIDPKAARNRQLLSAKLTSEQIAKAKSLALSWKPQRATN